MKKCTIGAGVLTAMMLFSPIAGDYTEASTQTTQQDTQKVMWGKNELSQTQIGRIVFSKDVKIYKRGTDGKVSFHMNAKKGSMWRVHKITTEGNSNVYDLGGGVRVKQSNLSTYERVPSDLAKKMGEQYGAKISWVGRAYPQVSRLVSKAVEDKINKALEEERYWLSDSSDNVSMEYSIVQNKNNVLKISILVTGTVFDTGHSSTFEYSKTYNLETGEITTHDTKLIDKNY